MNKQKIAFIPARKGSKSIPEKNIKKFCGKPLIFWNLLALENTDSIDKTFVATDSEIISKVVNEFNFSKVEVYDRDPINAQDESSTESVMLEFINRQSFDDDDLFFLVQATSPLTQSNDFDQALEILNKLKADSLLTCVRSKRFIWDTSGAPINYDYKDRPRRQDFQGSLIENGAFYINTIGNIKKSKNRLHGNIAIYEMNEFTFIEIDEEDDWIFAENLMKKHILENYET